MAIRLVKIAKELNVGLGTIVDFLKGKGYDIVNKPTTKISEEMHDALLVEFNDSMVAKEQADQLNLEITTIRKRKLRLHLQLLLW
ncbi:MAG: hypothetical protein V3V14_03320 [Saprospiraceae bacterium]